MKIILFTILVSVMGPAVAFAGKMEKVILTDLLKNSHKSAKDHCELGSGRKVVIRDFLAAYINWTFSSESLDRKWLKCSKDPDGKNNNQYSCDFKYSEKEKLGKHPGWDMDLEFKYTPAKGIDWSSVQCVSTP